MACSAIHSLCDDEQNWLSDRTLSETAVLRGDAVKSRGVLLIVLLLLVTAVVAPLAQQWNESQSPAVQTQLAPWLGPLTGGIESAFAQVDCQTYLLILVVDENGTGHIRAINSSSQTAEAQLANLYIDGSATPFGGPYAVPAVGPGQTSGDATPLVIGLPEGQHSYELVGSNGCGGQDQYTYLPARLTSLITNTCEAYTYAVDFTTNGSSGPRTVWITRETLNDNLQVISTETFGPFVFDGTQNVDDFYVETRVLPVRAQWSARMFKGSMQVQNDFARTYILPCESTPTDTPTLTPSDTPTVEPTATDSPTPSDTPTETGEPATNTPTPTATDTPVVVEPTATETGTPTETATLTPLPETDTPTWTYTPTSTDIGAATATASATASVTETVGQSTATATLPGGTPGPGRTMTPVPLRFAVCAGYVAPELVGRYYSVRDSNGGVLGPSPWGLVEWKPGQGAQVWLGFDPVLSGLTGQIVIEDGTPDGEPVLNFTFRPNGTGTGNCLLSPAT